MPLASVKRTPLDHVAARKREMFLPIRYVQRALTDLHEQFFVLETFQLCPLFLFSPQTLFGSQLVKQFPESRERFRFGLGIACYMISVPGGLGAICQV